MNNSDIKCKIVHLSDLHFGSNRFDKITWQMLCNKISSFEPKPHIILVTGDIIDTAFYISALKNARASLENLTNKCNEADLIVVPGNHDIGFKGNWPLPWSLNIFKKCFKEYYPDNNSRIKDILEKRGILIIPFNSNKKLRFATSEIALKELYSVDLCIDEIKGCKEFSFALRIAMLHHHPLPIPYVKARENDLEPFLILRNAGTLLMELSKPGHEFDLMIHGHKHYPNFARIKIGPKGTEIGVLAAGSACLSNPESGKNSFNVITVYNNGRINVEQFNYGTGQSIEIFNKESLFSLGEHKIRLFKRNFRRQGFKFASVEKDTSILRSGDSNITLNFNEMTLEGGRQKSGRPIEISVDKGRIIYDSVKLFGPSTKQGFSLQKRNSSLNRYEGWIDFGQTISSAKHLISYSLNFNTQSAYAMTPEELWRSTGKKGEPIESTTFKVSFPIEKLVMRVKFPQEDLFTKIKPFLKVSSWKNLMLSTIDDSGELACDLCGEPDIDLEMQSYEEKNLTFKNDAWILEMEYPVVGYIYEICWELSTEQKLSEFGYPKIPGEVEAYQRLLLQHRENCLKQVKTPPSDKMHNFIAKIFKGLYNQYKSFEPETFSLTLMTYDAKKNKLVIVDGHKSENGQSKNITWDLEIDPSIGNAGLAYKRGVPIVYNSEKDKDKSNFLESSSKTQYAMLVSFPIYHPQIVGEPLPKKNQQPVIAVFTIGSTSSATELIQLLNEDAIGKLDATFQVFGEAIINVFKEGKL